MSIPDEESTEQRDEDRLQMIAGLRRILLWIIGISKTNDNKRILRAQHLRTIVVLWFIDPHHFDCASQSSMARRFKYDKQSFNAMVASFRRSFDYTDVRFRSELAVSHMRRNGHTKPQ